MPKQLAFDDDEIRLGIKLRAHRADDFVRHDALDLLAFAVAGIEALRNGLSLRRVTREQQAQRFLRGLQPARGVEARRKLETDFIHPQRGRRLRHFLEGDEAGSLGGSQAVQSGGYQNAVLAGQGHDIRNGSQRDQIQQRTQIEFCRPGQAVLAAALDEGVGEFECEPDRAKFTKRRPLARRIPGGGRTEFAGIHERIRVGRRIGNLMMVQHDYIHRAAAAVPQWWPPPSNRNPPRAGPRPRIS